MDNVTIDVVTIEVANEVSRAVGLHPPFPSQHHAYAVILEELDEFWELVKINPMKLDEEARVDRLKEMRKELVQTAATCIRAIIDLGL